jgi:uncharacterized protein YqjF (DUF2071 family)
MIDRIAPTRRPEGPPQGHHQWRSLLFVHWEVPVATLRALVPERLAIDTHEGKAYVGLVPFTMRGIRPTRMLPPIPGVSAFHETNVRTYVHLDGAPGVWFFSLDAASSLAVRAARRFFHLPYFRAEMELAEDGDAIAYRSKRLWPEPTPGTTDVACALGEDAGVSEPGSLQFFLAERYFLYAAKPDGRIVRGQVHHTPYPLRRAQVTRLEESLLNAAGIARPQEIASVLVSPGVDVEVFPIAEVWRRVTS